MQKTEALENGFMKSVVISRTTRSSPNARFVWQKFSIPG